MSLDPERRSGLLVAKLAALVREHGSRHGWLDDPAPTSVGFGPSAGLVAGSTGWVLVEDRPEVALGAALAWAGKHGVDQLHLVVDGDAGPLARRAGLFELLDGAPTVWEVRGRDLVLAASEPLPAPVEPAADALELGALIVEAGAEVVIEHGEVLGEVAGLEIARVVRDERGVRLEVGVGHHDRDAFSMLHGNLPAPAALAKVVATVREHRRPDAPRHPLNELCAPRWLRHRLVTEPSIIGLDALHPVEGPTRRTSLLEAATAFALGDDEGGSSVLVACSVGVDLDLVPAAVDLWAAIAPEATVRCVVPARDLLPVTQRLAAAAIAPVEVVAIAQDWRG